MSSKEEDIFQYDYRIEGDKVYLEVDCLARAFMSRGPESSYNATNIFIFLKQLEGGILEWHKIQEDLKKRGGE